MGDHPTMNQIFARWTRVVGIGSGCGSPRHWTGIHPTVSHGLEHSNGHALLLFVVILPGQAAIKCEGDGTFHQLYRGSSGYSSRRPQRRRRLEGSQCVRMHTSPNLYELAGEWAWFGWCQCQIDKEVWPPLWVWLGNWLMNGSRATEGNKGFGGFLKSSVVICWSESRRASCYMNTKLRNIFVSHKPDPPI